MDKNITSRTFFIPLIFIILAILIYFGFFFNFKESNKKDLKNILTVSGPEIIQILKTNKDVNEYIQKKLDVLQIYIDAVRKENLEPQTFSWSVDEAIDSPAYNAIINKLKESKIGYELVDDGFIIFNSETKI